MTALELAKKVAALLDAKKAKDVEAIDIHGLTTIGDYFVVASGSRRKNSPSWALSPNGWRGIIPPPGFCSITAM